jgi:hypothetical protein
VSGKPSKEAVDRALEVIAEELQRLHPEWEVRVPESEALPPGAVTLPVLAEDDVETIRRRPGRNRR